MNTAQNAALESAKKGDVEAIKILLQRSDVKEWLNKEDKEGMTPLDVASREGHWEVAKLLVSSGANVNCNDRGTGWTPLVMACRKGVLEVMKFLVSSGANINCIDQGQNTPLHLACINGHLEVAKFLVSSGANINCTDICGSTPLNVASREGHLEVAKFLVSSEANINLTDKEGRTPLDIACFNGHLEVVKFLGSSGALVDIIQYDGVSAIGAAFRRRHVSVVEELIAMELKGQLCYQGGGGESLLHMVCKEMNVKMDLVTKLLERGLDATKRDQNGQLPVHYISDDKKKAEVSRLIGTVTSKIEERAEREKQRVEAEEREQREREEREKQEAAARQREAEEKARLERQKEDRLRQLEEEIQRLSMRLEKQQGAASSFHDSAQEQLVAADRARESQWSGIAVDRHVELGEVIGQGAFGKVYKGECDFQDVAVKVFDCAGAVPETIAAEVRREVKIMSELSHPNIVSLYGLVERAGQAPMLVMEFGAGGSLFSFLRLVRSGEQAFPWSHRLRMAFELSRGLAFLHKMGVVHRDIKSLNVILDEHRHAKWCDFGLSATKEVLTTCTAHPEGGDREHVAGTIRWLAPEQFSLDDSSPSRGADVWSLGMVFFELAALKIPYSSSNVRDVIVRWIEAGQVEKVPEDCEGNAPVLAEVIRQCRTKERSSRPSAADIANKLKAAL